LISQVLRNTWLGDADLLAVWTSHEWDMKLYHPYCFGHLLLNNS